MATNPDFKDLLFEFNARDVRYLIVGAHAVSHYTTPRYTKDLDLWVEPSGTNASKTFEALGAFGAPMDSVTPADFETPGTVFQVGVEPNRFDILTRLADIPFAEAWEARKDATYGGVLVHVVGVEHLRRSKRWAGRPQDLLDLSRLEKLP